MHRTWQYDPGLDPALTWTGKAERPQLAVPVLPLFEHEVVAPGAIAGPGAIAFEHGAWRNRLIHGDSLVVMTALLEYEGLGESVQTVFMDPPYGVRFGSNFQPFVRTRGVRHDDGRDLVREPEVIQAYRDTWELGIHSYLTYMRDRLTVARELLAPTGAIFVQIGDENVHRVRMLLDEVFGADAFVAQIPFRKKTMPLGARFLDAMCDHLLWYARDPERMTYRQLYQPLQADFHWKVDGGGRRFRYVSMKAPGYSAQNDFPVEFAGATYRPPPGGSWITSADGMERLRAAGRLAVEGRTLVYTLYWEDFPLAKITSLWQDTVGAYDKRYVVQTSEDVVARCLLMTSDPGDLVLDPTCGSGTTPLVAERWGRRWIAIDTARVPIALTRERLLTAVHPAWRLRDPERGPAGGLCYRELPRITLRTVAGGQDPDTVTLVDEPAEDKSAVRISAPFALSATGPPPIAGDAGAPAAAAGAGVPRMLEFLRRSPLLRLPGGRSLELAGLREFTGEFLHAEAEAGGRPVGLSLGPVHGAVAEPQVAGAAREARAAGHSEIFVVGVAFSVPAAARAAATGVTLVHATADLLLGDLLKTTRASELFAITGMPEFDVETAADGRLAVRLAGVDVFDPVEGAVRRLAAADVPAWFLDTDHDGRVFRMRQAQFPRTQAFEALRRLLGETWDDAWGRSTLSMPFEPGLHRTVAVKVVDDRGHELVAMRAVPGA
ncbi:MAG: site-specific DNA-methyltransferase [Candidatus Sericytochromatia bacterium]|nr:site-specific DNA-methyltransferase [Candidatus Tanganyikabacteria bacterium]